MSLEKSTISSSQFMFSIACFIQASSLLTGLFSSVARQNSWIIVLGGFLFCLVLLAVFVKLVETFPKKNLIQINDAVFGPVFGKGVSLLYIWFFLTLAALNLRDTGDFIRQTIMVETPSVVIGGIFLLLCAWAIFHGLRVMTRYSAFFTYLCIIILFAVIVFTARLMETNHFLPMFQLSPIEYLQGVNVIATIPFGEIVVFLMITPYVEFEEGKVFRFFFTGFTIGALTILLMVWKDTAILGDLMEYFSLPSFESIRLVSLAKTMSRMEIFFAVILMALLFFKVSILYYGTVLGIAQMLNLSTYRHLILPFGVIIQVYSIGLYTSTAEHAASGREIVPIFWLLFEFILPALTLAVVYLRRLHRVKQE